MTIRQATPLDKAQVLALYDEFSQFLHATDVPSQVGGGEQYDDIMNDPNMHIFVAEDGARLFGLANVYLLPNIRHGHRRCHIEDFFVSSIARRGGVGTQIFDAVKDYCRSQGVKTIKLDSGTELSVAHKFYEKNGGRTSERFFRFDF